MLKKRFLFLLLISRFLSKRCQNLLTSNFFFFTFRECPEECREAVSSLIYAAAWIPDVPELKDLRAVFTRRFGNFIASSVNHEVGLLYIELHFCLIFAIFLALRVSCLFESCSSLRKLKCEAYLHGNSRFKQSKILRMSFRLTGILQLSN